MRRFGLLVIVVFATGCGGGSSQPSASDAIRASVKSFVSAFATLKFDRACAQMTRAARAQLAGGDPGNCVDQLSYLRTLLSQDVIDELSADVDKGTITVHGDTAASTRIGGRLGFTAYRRVGGRWLIDASR